MPTATLDLPHGKTRAEVAGPTHGPAVIFVPGMTYPYEVFDPLFAAATQAGFRCLRYDLYGRGGSTHDGTALTLDVLVDQIQGVRSALDHVSPTRVISLSNSDLLTLRWFHRSNKQIDRIAWISPTGFDRRNMNWQRRTVARLPLLKHFFAQRIGVVARNRMQDHRADLSRDARDRVEAVYDTAIQSVQENPDFSTAVASHIGHLPSDAEVQADIDHLVSCAIPILACRFGQERDVSQAGTQAFIDHLPRCQYVDIPQGNHMGLLDQADELWPHLLAFLQGAPDP